MSKDKHELNNDFSSMKEIMEEHGISTDLDVDIVDFMGSSKDVGEDLLTCEAMTLHFTIKKILSEVFSKGGSQLLDAKYLKSIQSLIETDNNILNSLQNIKIKTSKPVEKVEDDSDISNLTESEIIQKRREKKQAEFQNSVVTIN